MVEPLRFYNFLEDPNLASLAPPKVIGLKDSLVSLYLCSLKPSYSISSYSVAGANDRLWSPSTVGRATFAP